MYYIIVNNQKLGPFTFDEIINLKLPQDTPIWAEQYEDWIPLSKAKEFNAYSETFKTTTRNTAQQKSTETPQFVLWFIKNGRNIGLAVVSVLLIIALINYFSVNHNSASETVTDSLAAPENPTSTNLEYSTTDSLAAENSSNTEVANENGSNTEKNCRDNWRNYISATVMDFTTGDLGGITNGYINVENNTPFMVDEIVVQIDYIKAAGGIYKTEYVSVSQLKAVSSENVSFPNSDRGTSVVANIISVKANEFGLEYAE